jgi:hypothetical protein
MTFQLIAFYSNSHANDSQPVANHLYLALGSLIINELFTFGQMSRLKIICAAESRTVMEAAHEFIPRTMDTFSYSLTIPTPQED